MISDAFAYPLRGSGRTLLIIGAVLSALLNLGASVPFLGLAAYVLGGAYFVAYYFDIIVTTVSGREDPPDFPDITDLYGDILAPLLRSLAALILAHLPLIALIIMHWGEGPVPPVYQWLCVAFAAFYFPMAILNVAVGDEAAGALPHRVLPDAIRAMPRYLILVLLLAVVYVVSRFAGIAGQKVPFVGGLVTAAVSLYFVMVQARMAGVFYRQWLEEEEVLGGGTPHAPDAPSAEAPSQESA